MRPVATLLSSMKRKAMSFIVVATALIGLAALSGCTQLGPYRVQKDPIPGGNGALPSSPIFLPEDSRDCEGPNACMQVVEFDQFGRPFNRAQLEAALSAAQAVAKDNGTVYVYVHGWHHGIKPRDTDPKNFLKLVANASREQPTLGIYVAWRGDSLDVDTPLVGYLSYPLTFWDRKSTAHAVGTGGGVTELLRRLALNRRAFASSKLAVIGHSLGGTVVYSSMTGILIDQVLADGRDPKLAGKEPATQADLVVLVNPALEAMRVRPLFELARSQEYGDSQPIRLVILTTQADSATSFWFPLGRRLGTISDSYSDEVSADMNVTAVGHYVPWVTHQLSLDPTCSTTAATEDRLSVEALRSSDSVCFPNVGHQQSAVRLNRCDKPASCEATSGTHYLLRGLAKDGKVPFNLPIANIRTTKDIMAGHTDIWNPTMAQLIADLLRADPVLVPHVFEFKD